MKLVRFGEVGLERPGIWIEEAGKPVILDVRSLAFDISDFDEHFFARDGLARLRMLAAEDKLARVAADSVRLGPPVARPSKILCLGANYADHARECGRPVPETPIVFSKATTAICGPNDAIVLPAQSRVVDWEVELALVIGRCARNVRAADAWAYVAGYLILNDVTDRVAQKAGNQWFCGKGPDSFCPLGPYLVTADEVRDPHSLRLSSKVNGKVQQDSTTAEMVHGIPAVIEHITRATTLLPGDILSTGTPAGIGSAQDPPVLLRAGDRLELEVEGLGTQRNEVCAERTGAYL